MKKFLIIVEGEADKKFITDYYQHIFHKKAPQNSIIHTGDLLSEKDSKTGGKDKLTHELNIGKMKENSYYGGTNLVIFDADKAPDKYRKELESIKKSHQVEFELFLMPNNKDTGALEDLLENIINPNNRPIFECWENYERELVRLDIPGRTPPPLTTPAKKTKIYGYLEALLRDTKSQKKLIKEVNRNYEDTLHWNLDAKYLEPLLKFLQKNIENE